MTAISVSAPFPILTDIDGSPLDAGYVYIGQPNLYPVAFPKSVYWDASLTTPAAQPIRTSGGYPVRNGSPARVYVDGDYSIRINNKNGTLVHSSPASTDRMDSAFVGYDGGTVQDVLDAVTGTNGAASVGYTPAGTGAVATTVQQQLRNIQSWTVNVKDAPFYAKGDFEGTTGTDDTAAFNAAFAAVAEYGTLKIPPGKYFVRGAVNFTNKNINIECSGTIILSDESAASINFTNTNVLTFPGTALSALPKIGDSALQWTTAPAGVSDASQYFFVLNSTEVEINRLNGGAFPNYTKNEAGDISTWAWLLRAPIKLDYTDASKLTVKLYRKHSNVTVRGLRVVLANTTGATSKQNRVVLSGLSNVHFDGLEVDSVAVNVPGVDVNIENCVGLSFRNSLCVGPSGAGDTYGFQNSCSAFLLFDNCEYRNPYNDILEIERGYVARHGANIAFRNCRFNGIDDHYGHDYYVENCAFSGRGVSFAGGNLTIKDCSMIGGQALVVVRSDTPYAYGKLTIDGGLVDGTDHVIYAYMDTDAGGMTTKVKFFDDIQISDLVINGRKESNALYFAARTGSGNVITKTKKLHLQNVVFNKLLAKIGCSLHGSGYGSLGVNNWVERAEFIDVDYRLIVTTTSGGFSDVTSVSLREFWADEVYAENFRNFIPYNNPQVQKMTVVNSSVGPAAGTEIYFTAGENTFIGCEILKAFTVTDTATAIFSFIDCTIKADIYGYGGNALNLKNKTAYLSRNKATPSIALVQAPGGSIEYYINPTYYKTT